MDIQKYVELLEQYPPWFKTSVALWVVVSALILVGFLTLRQSRPEPVVDKESAVLSHKTNEKITNEAAKSTLVPSSDVSFDDYAIQLRAHSDRFMERQELVHRLSGSVVSWDGLVAKVSESPPPSQSLFVTLESLVADPKMSLLVGVPNSMRAKAFSLRKGDVVRVTGKLTLNTPNFPDIEATELVMLKVRGG